MPRIFLWIFGRWKDRKVFYPFADPVRMQAFLGVKIRYNYVWKNLHKKYHLLKTGAALYVDPLKSNNADPDTKHETILVSPFVSSSLECLIFVFMQSRNCSSMFLVVLRIRIREPEPFWPLDPGSGIGFFRIPEPFWPLDPGSGIGFFRIPDPKPIFFRA